MILLLEIKYGVLLQCYSDLLKLTCSWQSLWNISYVIGSFFVIITQKVNIMEIVNNYLITRQLICRLHYDNTLLCKEGTVPRVSKCY